MTHIPPTPISQSLWLQVHMKFRFKAVSRLMTYQAVSLDNQFTQGRFTPVEVQLIFLLCINHYGISVEVTANVGQQHFLMKTEKKNLKNRYGDHQKLRKLKQHALTQSFRTDIWSNKYNFLSLFYLIQCMVAILILYEDC